MYRYGKSGSRRTYRKGRKRSSRTFSYQGLRRRFGRAVDQVYDAFINLNKTALDKLFSAYGVAYGERAEKYARNTYPKWKSGKTKAADQTMERLIEQVPAFLGSNQRFSILQEILKQNRPFGAVEWVRINVESPAEGFAELDKTLASMDHRDLLAHLPDDIMQTARWLYADDITAARSMLAEAERAENNLIRTQARREIALLKRTISSGQIETASYSVTMPAGTITVKAYTPPRGLIASISKFVREI